VDELELELVVAPPVPPSEAAVHVPPWQVPLEQAVPSAFAGFEHAPVAESQVPAAWHSSSAVHTTGLPPVQAPAVHACVHAPLHVVPSAWLDQDMVEVAGVQTWQALAGFMAAAM
jgi:hypothetical protein